MTLAAPAVAIAANQTKTVGHTAPLLPTPPSMAALPLAVPNSTGGGLMGSAPAVVTGNTVSNVRIFLLIGLCSDFKDNNVYFPPPPPPMCHVSLR